MCRCVSHTKYAVDLGCTWLARFAWHVQCHTQGTPLTMGGYVDRGAACSTILCCVILCCGLHISSMFLSFYLSQKNYIYICIFNFGIFDFHIPFPYTHSLHSTHSVHILCSSDIELGRRTGDDDLRKARFAEGFATDSAEGFTKGFTRAGLLINS